MRSLVVYFSRTGTTRKVAELAARSLGADLVELHTQPYGLGLLHYVRAAYDSVKGRLPRIEYDRIEAASYDFVLLLSPVWAGHAATPMRAYATETKGIKRAAAVLCCGGHAPPRAFDELAELAQVRLEKRVVLRQADVKRSATLPADLEQFLAFIRSA
ncbi:MAG TPA: hypothetical protein VGE69_02160 [Pseudomonadales bacterium]